MRGVFHRPGEARSPMATPGQGAADLFSAERAGDHGGDPPTRGFRAAGGGPARGGRPARGRPGFRAETSPPNRRGRPTSSPWARRPEAGRQARPPAAPPGSPVEDRRPPGPRAQGRGGRPDPSGPRHGDGLSRPQADTILLSGHAGGRGGASPARPLIVDRAGRQRGHMGALRPCAPFLAPGRRKAATFLGFNAILKLGAPRRPGRPAATPAKKLGEKGRREAFREEAGPPRVVCS